MTELDYISRIPRRIEYDDGIRRAFTPMLIFGCVGWWRADLGITFGAGSKVAQWADQSGAGNHLTQGTGANQPTRNTNVVNGRSVVTFSDASGTNLVSTAAGLAPATITMIIALRRTADQSIMLVGGRGDTGTAGYWIGTDTTDNLKADFGNGTTDIRPARGVGSWVLNQWLITAAVFDGTNGFIYKNGVSTSLAMSGSLNYAANPNFYLGQTTGLSAGRGMTGDIAECAIYNRALSAPELNRVTKLFGFEYGVAVAG